jgi:hypothetical protein
MIKVDDVMPIEYVFYLSNDYKEDIIIIIIFPLFSFLFF